MKEKLQIFYKNEGKVARVSSMLILFLGSQLLCYLFVWRFGMFGSKMDWINQHSVFPDYFRQRFYDTGSLLPDFAWNIGAGQNIYNFSYYGLFSPVILFSYLLPFVPMVDYIMVSSMLSYGLSVVLFYVWISDTRKGCPPGVSFLTSAMFGLAAPMMYHSYNQLMFINYMPFLVLALIGTDAYVEKRRSGLLIAGTLGMILTSFYFSIGGMLMMFLYICGEKVTFRQLAGYVLRLLAAVCMAGILLVPTALVLFTGNRGGSEVINTTSSKPFPYSERFLYSPYGMGLSAFASFSLLYAVLFPEEKKLAGRRHLQAAGLVLLLMIPIIARLLNGGLYAKDKVFMPFIPLVCLQAARCIKGIRRGDSTGRGSVWRWLALAACMAWFIWQTAAAKYYIDYKYLLILDGLLLAAGVAIFVWRRSFPVPLAIACICLLLYDGGMNETASKMVKTQDYENLCIEEKTQTVGKLLENDTGFYRIDSVEGNAKNLNNINRVLHIRQNITSIYSSGYNRAYQEFRKNTFQVNQSYRNDMMQTATANPFFLQFMGVKYVIGTKSVSGYEQVKEAMDCCVCVNEQAAPVCYATTQTMSRSAYDKLAFPDNQTSLMQYAAVDTDSEQTGALQNTMTECTIKLPEKNEKKVKIRKSGDGYEIEAEEEITLETEIEMLPAVTQSSIAGDDVFALQMDIDNLLPEEDMHVRVNGQTNRLTSMKHDYANHNEQFHFVVSKSEGKTTVTIQLGKGHYILNNIQAWTGSFDTLRDEKLYESRLVYDDGQPDGDSLSGTIKVEQDAWLITSIPYDSHFTIEVDGQETELQEVNTAFLGARLSAGRHKVVITYHAAGKTAGILLSVAGLLLSAGLLYYERRNRQLQNT